MRFLSLAIALLGVGLAPFCEQVPTHRSAPTTLSMDFTRAGGFFSAPFPSEDLRQPDGHIDLSRFPGRGKAMIVDAALGQLATDARGFSTTAGIFFTATGRLDPATLPASAAASLGRQATVYLVDVDRTSPGFGTRQPVDVAVLDDGGRFGAANLLSLVPYQGVPLRPSTLYAAVVTTGVHDGAGRPLGISPAMRMLQRGQLPYGLLAAAGREVQRGLEALGSLDEVAGAAVFRTDDPLAAMAAVREQILTERPELHAPLRATGVFPDFCVYEATIDLPQYQAGVPPFATEGGRWVFDAAGRPVRQRYERAGVLVTLPRAPMPARGFPTVVFSRTGAGGDRSLVEHGPANAAGKIEPGTGPALDFARAGFAAIMVDGPLGGLRNPQKADEQFLVFNAENPAAIRDNLRQSAAELILTAHLLDRLTVDASGCAGLAEPEARFDPETVALFGHSMGATIAPLALAFEPRFKAAILSGAGGSWIANLLHKQKPLPVRRITEFMFGYTARLFTVTQADPALSLVQWAIEAADPPLYGPAVRSHVLMFQGIADHYILPPMANATSLSLRLDLAGEALDAAAEELAPFAPFREVAALSGRAVVPYPVGANLVHPDGRTVTAAVVQRVGDGVQDAHEIVFQTAGPKYQYRCFLHGFARGAPRVVEPKDTVELCR